MRDDQIESMEKLAEEVADDFIVTTCAAINHIYRNQTRAWR